MYAQSSEISLLTYESKSTGIQKPVGGPLLFLRTQERGITHILAQLQSSISDLKKQPHTQSATSTSAQDKPSSHKPPFSIFLSHHITTITKMIRHHMQITVQRHERREPVKQVERFQCLNTSDGGVRPHGVEPGQTFPITKEEAT